MILYKVTATFEDFESTWTKEIGVFDNKEVANSIKEKWENFFKTKNSLFNEPDNWDTFKDEWFDEDDYEQYGFSWKESFQYNSLKSRYVVIYDFSSISIDEFELNSESFIDNFKHSEDVYKIMIEHDRDFKINKIIR